MKYQKNNRSAFVNFLNAKYERYAGTLLLNSYPSYLLIDPSSICPLKCPICMTNVQKDGRNIVKRRREGHILSSEVYNYVLDELGEYLFQISLYNWGEPLLNTQLPSFIRRAKDMNIYADVHTNLSIRLSDQAIEDLLLSGIDMIAVSIDGFSADIYETYRRGGDFNLVMYNLERLVALREKLCLGTEIIWNYLVFSFNEHEVNIVKQYCNERGIIFNRKDAIIDVSEYSDWLPSYRKKEAERRDRGWIPQWKKRGSDETSVGKTCAWHYFVSCVNADGSVSPCCAAGEQEYDFGKIEPGTTSFVDVWNDNFFRKARGVLSSREIKGLFNIKPLCIECPYESVKDMFPNVDKAIRVNYQEVSSDYGPVLHKAFSLLDSKEEFIDFYKKHIMNGLENSVIKTNMLEDKYVLAATSKLVELGEKLFTEGQYKEARELFLQLTDIVPDNYENWNNLGVAFLSEGNNNEAEKCLTKAVSLKNDYNEALENLRRLRKIEKESESLHIDEARDLKDVGGESYSAEGYGKCLICGHIVAFQIEDGFSLREARCPNCNGTKRSRDLAKAIIKHYLKKENISLAEGLAYLKDLAIYEAQADGPIHEYLSKLPKYVCSEYFDNVSHGSAGNAGIRCEDLENLTFPNNSFDLIVTQDVFEHVSNPDKAFKEIYRILKPGGYHFFTIPFHEGSNTITRAKKENGRVISLLPPVYHGDPLREQGSLVYTDFGDNILAYLASMCLPTDIAIHETFYPADVIPCISDESSYKSYLNYKEKGKMLKYFLYNSLVLKSRKEESVNAPVTKDIQKTDDDFDDRRSLHDTKFNLNYLENTTMYCERELLQLTNKVQEINVTLPVLKEMLFMLKKELLSSELSVKVGEICFGLGLYYNAGDFFKKALSVDSNNSDVLNNLGVLGVRFADYPAAERLFTEAIKCKPDNREARLNVAMLYANAPEVMQIRPGDVVCPCCEGSFPAFIPGGVNMRPNAQCPNCGSLERHRLLWLFLKNRTNFFIDNLRVLHVAPEDIFQKVFKSMSNIDYVSADMYSPSAMVKMDITRIPYGDNTFDVILCNHVLEHIIDDKKAMKELFRVLKPGGWAILQVPLDLKRERTFEDPTVTSPEERQHLFGQHDHVRWYGKDYGERLKYAGFQLSVEKYADSLDYDLIGKYGLVKSEDIYCCSKSC